MVKALILAASFSLELTALKEAVYFEARGEPKACQVYVAGVIKNRMLDDTWPDTIHGVVNQPYQFSYKTLPDLTMYETEAAERAERVAYSVITSENEPSFQNIVYFHTKDSNPSWAGSMTEVLECGNHIFYTHG